ncbi:MAG TPA: tetratricopeptide repeat protein [Acidobacteriota bacterium]|nr:tetratricopeptide repeat protein [Acidobacteriota bacterium]
MPLRLQRVILVFVVGGLIMSQLSFASPMVAQQVPPTSRTSTPMSTGIQKGLKAERDLSGGEQHTYPLTLKAGDYLKLVVEQRGIDVVVRLLGPDGNQLAKVDSPNGTEGPEPLSLIAEQAGTYTLEVASFEKTARAGKYELNQEAVKPATEQDRARFEIEALVSKVEKLRQAGTYDEALTLATQALEKSEHVFGQEDLLVATSLYSLAMLYYNKDDYTRAEPLHQRALAIREKVLGPDHPDVAQSLNSLAALYQEKGDYARAELFSERSLGIREKVLGPDHPDVALSLNNLAVIYNKRGKTTQAESLYLRALAIREKSLGSDHLNVAFTLNDLALFYGENGDYTQAEQMFKRSLAMKEKSLGPDHLDVATSLNNLGWLYQAKADYTQAEQMFKRSLAIKEKSLGPDHSSVGTSLNNLASLYHNKGDFAQAELLYRRSLAIREKVLGPDHPEVANTLSNLALLYRDQGDYGQAEPLYQRSVAISEKVLGPDHPFLARSLNNLAQVYEAKGDYTQAESLYLRSLAIREKALRPDHPEIAASLNNLAFLYQVKGDYVRAEPLYLRSLAIWERTLSPDHPNVAYSLGNLAGFFQARSETAQAIVYRTRGNEVIERDLLRNLASGSEQQKALYLKTTANQTDQSISLHVQAAPQDEAALRTALTVILRRKGRALDAMTNALAILRSQSDPETQKLLDDYARIVGQISAQTLKGPGQKKLEEHLAYLQSLEAEKNKLENDISRRSGEFKVQTTPITLEGVQQLIPADAALVEYAVYRPVDMKTRTYGKPRYVAYVVKPGSGTGQGTGDRRQGTGGASQNPQSETQSPVSPPGTRNPEPGTLSFVDLGEAEPIDQVVVTLRKMLSDRSKSVSTQVKPTAQVLDQLVMKPVRALVGNTKHLLISPDGALNLIPFAALVDERGQFVVERYTLTYLTSGRDLLRLGVKFASHDAPFVIADPDYATGEGPHLLGQIFPPLRRLIGTHMEGEKLKEIFPNAQLKLKGEANETILKQVNRPELIHIATHGYFLKDAAEEASAKQGTRVLTRSEEPPIDPEKLRANNPLMRSWLFFAGANKGGSEDNDGTMTALEAAQLNLWGTKLVTLSACETAVGEAKTGDGVYGLRRALVLAGSEAQMMSLWSVSDQGTRELMVDYYTRLKNGEGRSEALRNTQLKLLKDPKRQHPFYWASFIQSGEWANLDGKR